MSISVFEKIRQRILQPSNPDQPRPDVGPTAPRVPLKIRAAKVSAAFSHVAVVGLGAVALHTRPDLVTSLWRPPFAVAAVVQAPLHTARVNRHVPPAKRVAIQAIRPSPSPAVVAAEKPSSVDLQDSQAATPKTVTAVAAVHDVDRANAMPPSESQLKALPLTIARGVVLPEARLVLATAAPLATIPALPMSQRARDVVRDAHKLRVVRAREREVTALSAVTATQPVAAVAAKPIAAAVAPPLTKWAALTPEQQAEANVPVKKSTPYTVANVWTEEQIAAARAECGKLLKSVSIITTKAEPVKEGACGAPAPVNVSSVGSPKVELHPASIMTCPMAAALDKWMTDKVQPAAQQTFGAPVARLISASSYSCRNRYGSATTPLSEHALVNALDLAGFVLADGRTVRVKQDWGPVARDAAKKQIANNEIPIPDNKQAPVKVAIAVNTAPSKTGLSMLGGTSLANKTSLKIETSTTAQDVAAKGDNSKTAKSEGKTSDSKSSDAKNADKKGDDTKPDDKKPANANKDTPPAKDVAVLRREFLQRVHAGACDVFGTVLGPEANDAHRDHFHLDMKARRHRAYCQ